MGINKMTELTVEFVYSFFVFSYTPGLFSDPMTRWDSIFYNCKRPLVWIPTAAMSETCTIEARVCMWHLSADILILTLLPVIYTVLCKLQSVV